MSYTHYNEEMRLQTIKLVLKGDKSAAKIAKDLGINQNTVSRWVKEYRKQNNLPTYEEERRIRKVSVEELAAKNKELERKLKQKEKGDHKAEMRSYKHTSKRAFSQEDVLCLGDTTMFLLSLTKRREKRRNLFCHFRADRSTMA